MIGSVTYNKDSMILPEHLAIVFVITNIANVQQKFRTENEFKTVLKTYLFNINY